MKKTKFLFVLWFLLTVGLFAQEQTAIRNIKQLNVTPDQCSFQLNWEPSTFDLGGATWYYAVFRSQHSIDAASPDWNDKIAFVPSSDTSYTDADTLLEHLESYYFRVYVFYVNNSDTVCYPFYVTPSEGPFAADCQLDATISNFRVDLADISGEAATLYWSYQISGGNGIDDIVVCSLYWDTTAGLATAQTRLIFPVDPESYRLEGLKAEKTYFVRLAIHDAVGHLNDTTIQFSSGADLASITQLEHKSLKAGKVQLSWTTYPASLLSRVQEFQIWRSLYYDIEIPDLNLDGRATMIGTTTTTTYTDENVATLAPLDTLYYYQVIPVSKSTGLQKLGNNTTRARSDRQAPPKPEFNQEDWGYNKGLSFQVCWSDVNTTVDPVTYEVAWFLTGGAYQNQTTVTGICHSFSNTQAGTVNFAVWSEDSLGNGSVTDLSHVINDNMAPVTTPACPVTGAKFFRTAVIEFSATDKVASTISDPVGSGVARTLLKYEISDLAPGNAKKTGVVDGIDNAFSLDAWQISGYDTCQVRWKLFSIDEVGNLEDSSGYSCGPFKFINRDVLPPVTTVTCPRTDTIYSVAMSVGFATEDKATTELPAIIGSGVERSILKFMIQNLGDGSQKTGEIGRYSSGAMFAVYDSCGWDSCQVWLGIHSIDKENNLELFSDYTCGPFTFVNKVPAVPLILSPATGNCTNSPVIAIDWNDQPYIDRYDVEQSDVADFSANVTTQQILRPNSEKTAPSTWTFNPTGNNQFYYYRVKATNAKGSSVYSAVVSVYLDQTAPAVTAIIPAITGDTTFFSALEKAHFTITFNDSIDVAGVSATLTDMFNIADNITYTLQKTPSSGRASQLTLSVAGGMPQHSVLQLMIDDLEDCAGNQNAAAYSYLYETWLETENGGAVVKHLTDEPKVEMEVPAGSFSTDMRLHIILENAPEANAVHLVADDQEELEFLSGKSVFSFSATDSDGNPVTSLSATALLDLDFGTTGSDETGFKLYIFQLDNNVSADKPVWKRVAFEYPGTNPNQIQNIPITDLGGKYAVVRLELPDGKVDYAHNYPNPFDPRSQATTIRFSLSAAGSVEINIYDFFGGKIRQLTHSGVIGINELTWDGRNGEGNLVADGGYMALIKSSGKTENLKIAVLKK